MKKKFYKKKRIFFLIPLIISFFLSLIYYDNKTIVFEDFNIINNKNIKLKIMHLSDLHFPKVNINLNKLYNQIIFIQPDFIAITGDLIDRGAKVEKSGVYEFIDNIYNLAPIYFIDGNHEYRNKEYSLLLNKLNEKEIKILNNDSYKFTNDITILGLSEGSEYNDKYYNNDTSYKILLTHRPEHFNSYISNSIVPDLILTGHAHGGQIRVFNQGIFAPGQGLFPNYDKGLYEKNQSKMIVSRGIGNSVFPFRINNKPHIPVVAINY